MNRLKCPAAVVGRGGFSLLESFFGSSSEGSKMAVSPILYARSIHTIASDRIYRVENADGALYFLRVGGQFNLDRGGQIAGPLIAEVSAVAVLGTAELLFRKHKDEELIARDPSKSPEELLTIHPHNFKVAPADVKSAALLAPSWLALLRLHFGRLHLTQNNGPKWEFHFERLEDMQQAFQLLPPLFGDRLEMKVAWDESKQRFVKAV
jgi:hypothetical protein